MSKNKKLSPFQEKFCLLYHQTNNALQSYKDAYGVTKNSTAGKNSHRLLQLDYIQDRLRELREDIVKQYKIQTEDLIRVNAEVAFAKLSNVIEVVDGEFRIKKDADPDELEALSFTSSESFSAGKHGDSHSKTKSFSVKRGDRVKAAQELAKLIGSYESSGDDQDKTKNAVKSLMESLAKFKSKKDKE